MQPQPPASASDDGEPAPAPSIPSRKKLRELKLRADKLVDVQGPTLVRCLLCGAMIKLSTKSEFDASHWLRHRARCVKRSKAREGAVGAGARARAQPPPRSSAGASSSDSAASGSPTLSARALTPQEEDDDDNADSEEGGESDPQQTHADDDGFLVWQSWDWSQLKSRFFPPI